MVVETCPLKIKESVLEKSKDGHEKTNGTESVNNDILRRIQNGESILKVKEIGTDPNYVHEIVWVNAIFFWVLHTWGLMGLFVMLTGGVTIWAVIWSMIVLYAAAEGVTIGAHRMYTHKSFKGTPILRAGLILLQTVAGQNSMFIWCRDHRLHHRYSDTDADPHNAKRGFFFSHMGWLMMKKHPYVLELGKRIDMSDLEADWMVMMQKKYYYPLYFILAVIFPVMVPVVLFGDTILNSFLVCYGFRYALLLNGAWLVNSAAHIYGTRPYDKNLQPVESWFVSLITLGEGWHNYHHVYPWDYKAAELSMHFNFSATIIRWLERLGLAYDLKTATPEMVKNRILRTGDGTHYELGNDEARSRVTAVGPVHPINPTYNVSYEPPPALLEQKGLPLYHETDYFDVTRDSGIKKFNGSAFLNESAALARKNL